MEKAARFSPDQLRRLARRAIEAVEPDQTVVDAHENELIRTEEQAARDKCSLTLHDNGDGTTTGHFTIPALAAAMLGKVIDAMTAPRRMRAQARPPSDGHRSFDWRHRRGLAFAELLEHLPTDHLHTKTAATVVVTIDHTVLAGALKAAHLDTDQTLSAGEARRLACNAGDPPRRPRHQVRRPRPRPREPAVLRIPARCQRTRTHHLRRHRLRTPLRLVRAPPPTTLGQRRQDRPRQRDPALPPTPPMDPRHRLQPPDHARRQHPIQQTHVSTLRAGQNPIEVRSWRRSGRRGGTSRARPHVPSRRGTAWRPASGRSRDASPPASRWGGRGAAPCARRWRPAAAAGGRCSSSR